MSPQDQGLDLETGFAADTSVNVTTSTLEVSTALKGARRSLPLPMPFLLCLVPTAALLHSAFEVFDLAARLFVV